ncbi:mucin-5AC-like [Homarus americanus]|uniref:mucin-5AC-like n=1 Tax=Homarus americanus TaxID=6706 RepID=UPI001C468B68|nr:mucin-5AC-like [Homarus americanus]
MSRGSRVAEDKGLQQLGPRQQSRVQDISNLREKRSDGGVRDGYESSVKFTAAAATTTSGAAVEARTTSGAAEGATTTSGAAEGATTTSGAAEGATTTSGAAEAQKQQQQHQGQQKQQHQHQGQQKQQQQHQGQQKQQQDPQRPSVQRLPPLVSRPTPHHPERATAKTSTVDAGRPADIILPSSQHSPLQPVTKAVRPRQQLFKLLARQSQLHAQTQQQLQRSIQQQRKKQDNQQQQQDQGEQQEVPLSTPTIQPQQILPTSQSDAPRTLRPISFQLGARVRGRYRRPSSIQGGRSAHRDQHGAGKRLRARPRYVRPQHPRQLQKSSSATLITPLSARSKNRPDDSRNDQWTPNPEYTTLRLLSTTQSNTSQTTHTTAQPPASSVANTNIDLQRIRKLFSQVQERTKAAEAAKNANSSLDNSSSVDLTTTSSHRHYSSTYTKVTRSGSTMAPTSSSPSPPSLSTATKITVTSTPRKLTTLIPPTIVTPILTTPATPIPPAPATPIPPAPATPIPPTTATPTPPALATPIPPTTATPTPPAPATPIPPTTATPIPPAPATPIPPTTATPMPPAPATPIPPTTATPIPPAPATPIPPTTATPIPPAPATPIPPTPATPIPPTPATPKPLFLTTMPTSSASGTTVIPPVSITTFPSLVPEVALNKSVSSPAIAAYIIPKPHTVAAVPLPVYTTTTNPLLGAAPPLNLGITRAEPKSTVLKSSTVLSQSTRPSPLHSSLSPAGVAFLKKFNLLGFAGSKDQQQPSLQGEVPVATSGVDGHTSAFSSLLGRGNVPNLGGLSSNIESIEGFSHNQGLGSLGGDSHQFGQQQNPGLGGLGYLELLSSLGVNLGQQGGQSSSPELSLTISGQGISGQQQQGAGLGIFSGLSGLGLTGFGNLANLGNFGSSIPGLGSIGGGSSGSDSGTVVGLSDLSVSGKGPGGLGTLSDFGSGLSNLGGGGLSSRLLSGLNGRGFSGLAGGGLSGLGGGGLSA